MSDPFNKSSPQSFLCFHPHAPKPSYHGLKRGQQACWLILDLFHEKSSLQFKAISLHVQPRHESRLFYRTSGMNIPPDCLSCFMVVYRKSPYGDQQYHSLKVGLLLLDGCQELIPPAGTFDCTHLFQRVFPFKCSFSIAVASTVRGDNRIKLKINRFRSFLFLFIWFRTILVFI